MSYSINLYNADAEKQITENHPERNSAIILGLNYLFPAYLIDLYGDELYKDLKTDGPKVFDRSKIENHNLSLLNL
ncbi:MAG: hypothetical protein MJ219_02025 [Mycoplasmoidaceae bacterium]|nr:hypothetical protein [Mycoplasmoidaceae bacterium]